MVSNIEDIDNYGQKTASGNKFDGVIRELGELPEHTVLTQTALARMLNCSEPAIRHAVQCGMLPPGTPLTAGDVWTVKIIREHISQGLARAARNKEGMDRIKFRLLAQQCSVLEDPKFL